MEDNDRVELRSQEGLTTQAQSSPAPSAEPFNATHSWSYQRHSYSKVGVLN